MQNPRYKVGYILENWVLEEILGIGGNAEVWKAKNNKNDSKAAIKILRTKDTNTEPFKRFKDELKILNQLGDQAGILPLISYNIPSEISKQSPAWLAMPVAVLIIDSLGTERSLNTVVKAIAEISKTLSELAQKKIYHRDIKPENLYWYKERWVIGDFGLVDYPNKEALTENDRKLGPMYFIAPEMLMNPRNSDGGPADVYSLAKTLWVLATGQKYPPPGEQRVENDLLRLETYVVNPRAYILNRLIEDSTKYYPKERPSMTNFSRELFAWLDPPNSSIPIKDLSNIAPRIIALTEPDRRSEEKRQGQIHLAREISEKIQEKLTIVSKSLSEAGLSPSGVGNNRKVIDVFKKYAEIGEPNLLFSDGFCVVLQSPGPNPIYLWSGIGIELYDDGKLNQIAAHIIGDSSNDNKIIWSRQSGSNPVGSSLQEYSIIDLINQLIENLSMGLESFSSRLIDK